MSDEVQASLAEAQALLAAGRSHGALALLRRLRSAHPEDVDVQLKCAAVAAAAGHKELARSALLDAVGLWRPPEGPDPLRFLAVVEAGVPPLAWHADPVDWRIGQGLLTAWRLEPDRPEVAAALGRFLSYLDAEPHGLWRAPPAYQVLNSVVGTVNDPRTRWRWLLACLEDLDFALFEWPAGLQPSQTLPAGATPADALAVVRRALAVGAELVAGPGLTRELREVLDRLRDYEEDLLTLEPAPDRGSPAF